MILRLYSLYSWICTKIFLFPPASGNHFLLFMNLFFVVVVFKIPHISNTTQYLSFSSWLISLSPMPSRSIHVVTRGGISFGLWRTYVLSQFQSKLNISTSWNGFLVIIMMKQWLSTCGPDTNPSILCVTQFSLYSPMQQVPLSSHPILWKKRWHRGQATCWNSGPWSLAPEPLHFYFFLIFSYEML